MIYKIRTAKQKDVKTVYDFICELEETSLGYLIFESIFINNIADKNKFYFVAETESNGVIGFISCHMQNLLHHAGCVAEIQELFVDNKYRGAGIGKRLINTVEKELLKNDCLLLEVTAQHKRFSTHAFYEASGFCCTHKKFVKLLS